MKLSVSKYLKKNKRVQVVSMVEATGCINIFNPPQGDCFKQSIELTFKVPVDIVYGIIDVFGDLFFHAWNKCNGLHFDINKETHFPYWMRKRINYYEISTFDLYQFISLIKKYKDLGVGVASIGYILGHDKIDIDIPKRWLRKSRRSADKRNGNLFDRRIKKRYLNKEVVS